MSSELIRKIIRCLLIALIFLPTLRIIGMDDKEAQQFIVMLAVIVIFSFLLKNIWVTLFMAWSVFLYSYFKFETGQNYITNIFIGAILYYLVKVSFKKEHIKFFINGVLWFTALNILYMALQAVNFDFLFVKTGIFLHNGVYKLDVFPVNDKLYGFMGSFWALATLFSLSIPLLLSKDTLTSKIGALALLFPLYLCNISLCLIMAIFGGLFVLWFQIPKIIWSLLVVLLLCFGLFYVTKIDDPLTGLKGRAKIWKAALTDVVKHPITGYGLDSFRNVTKSKPYKYMQRSFNMPIKDVTEDNITVEVWDNPHNLGVSLLVEFSLIGLFIFGGYLRGLGVKYHRAIKSNQVIALAGFVLVFLGVSLGHFPIFLARFTPLLIPGFSLFEVSMS